MKEIAISTIIIGRQLGNFFINHICMIWIFLSTIFAYDMKYGQGEYKTSIWFAHFTCSIWYYVDHKVATENVGHFGKIPRWTGWSDTKIFFFAYKSSTQYLACHKKLAPENIRGSSYDVIQNSKFSRFRYWKYIIWLI